MSYLARHCRDQRLADEATSVVQGATAVSYRGTMCQLPKSMASFPIMLQQDALQRHLISRLGHNSFLLEPISHLCHGLGVCVSLAITP